MQEQRTCAYCATPLTRRPGRPGDPGEALDWQPKETTPHWLRRKHCGTACEGLARMRAWVDVDGPPWTVDEKTGCWLWDRAITRLGYGKIARGKGESLPAHRWVYEQAVGPIPEGMEIDHVRERGCRSKACVNPAHLEPVTSAENVRRSQRVKLTLAAVREIRRRHAVGDVTQVALAEEFGVCFQSIHLIVRNRTWKE